MIDQASVLRQSVWRARQEGIPRATAARPSVAVVAGKGGVGTTTVAVQLATAWAHREQQVCVIDTDTDRHDVAYLLQIPEHELVFQQRTPRQSWFRHTLASASGPHVACASSWCHDPAAAATRADQFLATEHPFDLLVVDVGCQPFDQQLAWCLAASVVVLVTTPETISIVDSYGFLKRLARTGARPSLGMVGNQVTDVSSGHRALQRLGESTQRFLGWNLRVLGQIPLQGRLHGGDSPPPSWLASPHSAAGRAMDEITTRLGAAMSAQASPAALIEM